MKRPVHFNQTDFYSDIKGWLKTKTINFNPTLSSYETNRNPAIILVNTKHSLNLIIKSLNGTGVEGSFLNITKCIGHRYWHVQTCL